MSPARRIALTGMTFALCFYTWTQVDAGNRMARLSDGPVGEPVIVVAENG